MKYIIMGIVILLSSMLLGQKLQSVTKKEAIEIANNKYIQIIKSAEERKLYRMHIEDSIFTVDSLIAKYDYYKRNSKNVMKLLNKLKKITFWYCRYIVKGGVGGDIHLFINAKNRNVIHLE